jgi:threonine/homoserine/homoserine lactone efflux protein
MLIEMCSRARAITTLEVSREFSVDSLVAFFAISAVVIVTPGQDTALTIRNTLLGGVPAGRATAIGVAGGQLVWTLAAAAGVTALLVAFESLFAFLRLAGAAYLIYLGATTLWGAVRGQIRPGASEGPYVRRLAPPLALRQGLLSNLGNPKMVVFFSSMLPQFAPSAGPTFVTMLGLGLLFCAMTLLWLSGYAWVIGRAGIVFLRSAVRRAVDGVMGMVLVVFGIRLAAEST